jgi:hypothetical protein
MKPIKMDLLENAHDFLNESIRSAIEAEERPQAWKFAVLHVVQAIELLLKARLEQEHPVLIYESVDRQTKTVSLTQAVERITTVARIRLTPRERRAIRKAQQWRDPIVHHRFEMSPYEVKSVFVQLFEFLTRFHDDHTGFGPLHDRIVPELWAKEAELMEFFREEFVTYNGQLVSREWPREIVKAQDEPTVVLHETEYDRIRHGDEREGWEGPLEFPCHDCAVIPGQLHVLGCDMERCPRCFRQLLTCGCLWDEGPADDELLAWPEFLAREKAADAAWKAQQLLDRLDPVDHAGNTA